MTAVWIVAFIMAGRALERPPLQAQESIDGRWGGAILVLETELRIAVDFRTAQGELSAKIDIPQQAALGLALTNVVYDPPAIHFELPAGPGLAVFEGTVHGDSIAGDFTQAGVRGSFYLRRGGPPREEAAPDTPVPYVAEDVRLQNGDVTLAGTLTLPPTGGPHPAVVLITGSGPQSRDGDVAGFKVLRIIADHLTRRGVAVLRYDDRGVGGSTGSTSQSTIEDLAGDALAAMRFLQGRRDVRPKQIGLMGHSEGGVVAALTAARTDDVAFVVLMAGMAITGEELLYVQGDLIAKAMGATEAQREAQRDLQRRVFDAVRSGEGWNAIETDLRAQVRAGLDSIPAERRQAIADPDAYVEHAVEAQLAMARTPWFRFFLDYDPAPVLQQVRQPVLALFGALDLQVPPDLNSKALADALETGGNQDYTIRVLPKANHLFQVAETGSPSEYAELRKEFVPGFLELVTTWIRQHTATSNIPCCS